MKDEGVVSERIIYINFEDYQYRKLCNPDTLYEYVEQKIEGEEKYYLLSDERVVEREFGAYAHIQDNYPKYVITLDRVPLTRDGIIHKNLIDFLLESK